MEESSKAVIIGEDYTVTLVFATRITGECYLIKDTKTGEILTWCLGGNEVMEWLEKAKGI